MTAHELSYCQYLLRCVKDLYIERAAHATILDTPRLTASGAPDWRLTKETMVADPVFRSAVEANFAPLFERLTAARHDERVFGSMLTAAGNAPAITSC